MKEKDFKSVLRHANITEEQLDDFLTLRYMKRLAREKRITDKWKTAYLMPARKGLGNGHNKGKKPLNSHRPKFKFTALYKRELSKFANNLIQ